MTRPELIKALEDNGAEFKGYKRAKAGDLQEALDLMIGKRKLDVMAEWLENSSDPKPVLTDATLEEVRQSFIEDEKPPAKPRANWGANEPNRHCANQSCKSTNSRITDTKNFHNPERTVRYRVCLDCGQKYSRVEHL